MIVEYRIDALDVLVEAGQGWATYAHANHGPELVPPPLGRSLWSFMAGDEVTEVWRQLVRRARSGPVAPRVRVRCDAPAERRWFDITLTADEDAAVRFRSVLIGEQARPVVPLVDLVARRDPDAPLVAVCSWCARFRSVRGWIPVEDFVADHDLLERSTLPGMSHTICPSCEARVFGDLGQADAPLG